MGTLSQLAKANSKKVCPLCSAHQGSFYHEDRLRKYYQCKVCNLVYVPKQYWLSHNEEKVRYDQHENNIEDQRYRHFLSEIIDPLLQNLPKNVPLNELHGLDFGCGPGPALAIMLSEKGFNMKKYDLFYYPDKDVLDDKYDFITTTEVVEHLQNPKDELNKLWQMLKPNGVLAIMTKRATDLESFKNWYYKGDDTHIVFFSEKSFRFLGEKWGCKAKFETNDVVVFTKTN